MLGLAVFIVEDEPLLTLMLEEMLGELGCSVAGTAATVDQAMADVATIAFDVALLDVHLRGEPVSPLADRLCNEGRHFVVASGDDGRSILARYPGATFLAKPYELESLATALKAFQNPATP